MPTIVKIGLSRKLTKDYNSTGFSLEIQSELPATAVQDPNEMASATENLYQLAEDLLNEQVKKHTAGESSQELPKPIADRVSNGHRPQSTGPVRTQGTYRSNGGTNGAGRTGVGTNGNNKPTNGNGSGRGITAAQVTAIERMSKRAKIDPDTYASDEWGAPYKSLSIKQASDMIDALKGMIETGSSQEAN